MGTLSYEVSITIIGLSRKGDLTLVNLKFGLAKQFRANKKASLSIYTKSIGKSRPVIGRMKDGYGKIVHILEL